MELRELIEDINEKLLSEYGTELSCGNKPRFRVVFSDDQYEKRWTDYTDDGFELVRPEVRILPKYKQWVRGKYILERLVPVVGETDLLTRISYEPAWVFEDKHKNYLPPFFEGCKYVIESMYQAIGKKDTFTKYKDKNISEEERLIELKRVEDLLFGNETIVGDHLAYKTGVTVPGNETIN
jgi:hypothetical protein